MRMISMGIVGIIAWAFATSIAIAQDAGPAKQAVLAPLKYHDPTLTVDLGVGLWAWPVPCDADGDGDFDLIVSCPDKPYNGTYLFENPGGSQDKFPIFRPAKRLSVGQFNVTPSYVDGRLRVTTPGYEHPDFLTQGLGQPTKLPLPPDPIGKNPDFFKPHTPGAYKTRHNQWRYVDYDGDNNLDLVIGLELWSEYGWDDAWNERGEWKNGPLHGLVFLLRNRGSNQQPEYTEPTLILADSKPVSTYGLPSPNFADFDHDGDLDLLCGEFLDGFTYFENVGTRAMPVYTVGRRLTHEGRPLMMDLQMIVPVAFDWDRDGDLDLIVGDEDGRVAIVENTGLFVDRVPQFQPPHYFQQQADDVKFGALATVCGFDWDGDGDDDIIAGNTAGYIAFIENVSTSGQEGSVWAAPKKLQVDGKTIRIQAGPNGSIQGPAEAKWGYTTQSVADWDHDGLPDLIVNSIWGKVHWYRNVGERTAPRLAKAQPIEVEWTGETPKPAWTWWTPDGKELVTQWRTTPVAIDFDRDGLTDLVMLDHEGYLAFFRREKRSGRDGSASTVLLPGERIFVDGKGEPLRLNSRRAGGSGRRKLCVVDWDGDGRLDVLVNGVNANLLRQTDHRDGKWFFEDLGPLDTRKIEGHDTSPTTVDWNRDGIPDLLVGAEDGRFYYLPNPRTALKSGDAKSAAVAQVDSKDESIASEQKSAIVKTEFLYEAAPFPSCHASTIVESNRGLVTAWFGGTAEKNPDVGVWVSQLVDGKWTAPIEVANGVVSTEKRYPCWNPVLFQPRTGPLLLFYKVGPSPDTWWGMAMTSDDAGATWSKPRRLPEGILGPIKNKPVQLSNGDILSGTSSEDDGWRVHFERSSDLGKTWQRTAPVNDGEKLGAIQPSILIHKDGRLQAVGRTQQQFVFEITSTDQGKTWGPMTLMSLPNPNAGTDATTLSDGRHLIVYNHTARGRSPLNVAVSGDGKNWQAAIVLEHEPGEYSYPAVIQTSDGLVHITYTWKRKLIKHVVIDPKLLKTAVIVDSKWPAEIK
ncbi:MAG TPA: exo-alpha-sialidase [Schlesneria sp.]